MTKMETTKHTKRSLPDGWRWVGLGEYMPKNVGSLNPAIHPNEMFVLYSIPAFDRGMPDKVFGKAIGSTKQIVLPGDVLLSKIVPHIRRTCVVGSTTGIRMIASTEWIVFRTHEADSEYLKYILTNDDFHREFMNTTSGVGGSLLRARPVLVARIQIPLPSLAEQRRIAGVLRQQMAAVEKARAAAEARLEAVKSLPAAYLRQVFPPAGQPLPAGWKWVRLGEVCQINPRRGDISRSENAPTSFVPMETVDAEQGAVYGMRERPFSEVKKGYTIFEEGDVLFAKITPCMQNGKHAIACGLIDGFGFASTEFHVIRPTNEILAEWIHYFVRQPIVLQEATNHFTGAVGQQRVPDDFLKSLDIPLPPLDEQRRIAGVMREQVAAVHKARAAAGEELQTINVLPAALLRRAFNGEI